MNPVRSNRRVPMQQPVRKGLAIIACLAVGSVFVALFIQMRQSERRTVRDQLEMFAEQYCALLRSEVQSSMQVLKAVVSLREVELLGSREEFRVFVRRSLAEHPELQALEWVPRVRAADRTAYERAAHDDGYPDFAIRESVHARDRAQPQNSIEYFPVYYVEPIDGNEWTLGLDGASDADQRSALESARDTGQLVTTAPLGSAPGTQTPLLMVAPVFCRAATLASPDERRRALTGYVVGVVRPKYLNRPALAGLPETGVTVEIADAETLRPIFTPASPRLASGSAHRPSHDPAAIASTIRDVAVGGRTWRVRFTAGASYVQGYSTCVIPLGAGFTLLFAAYLLRGLRYATEIEQRVQARTVELSNEVAARAEAERGLAQTRDLLEARVRERTLELAQSNEALQDEISVRKNAEQEAARANQAKSTFLASVSHEIRTPLNAILGYAHILEANGDLPEDCRGPVQTIATSGRHLLGVVNDVLDLSKIEAGCAELHVAEFDLAALLAEVGRLFEVQCRQKGLEFRVENDLGSTSQVRGDSGKLRQILINLLGNALKFTPCGGITLRTRVVSGGSYLFEVEDSGVGIPEASLDLILRPFRQETAGREAGGTGLGLAIAKSRAELMGGRIDVVSHVDQGSTFSLFLPFGKPERAEAKVSLTLEQRLSAETPLTALVVDDVRENREVLSRMLSDTGCRVVLASSGRQAIEKAALLFSNPGDTAGVVFLDVGLPDIDGKKVLSQIRDQARMKLRMIAHSASVFAHEQAEYLQSGFDDFLPKPLEPGRLYDCLAAIPGVVLTARAPLSDGRGACAEPAPAPGLSPRLRHEILEAARIHNATALRASLKELCSSAAGGHPLVDQLRAALRAYDMRTIVALLSERATTTEPGFSGRAQASVA
jgi:signal transduction histidine kinase/CheY-like chemotaxis protein